MAKGYYTTQSTRKPIVGLFGMDIIEADEKLSIPTTIDGLENAVGKVLTDEPRLKEDLEELLIHARIREEYKEELRKREWGSGPAIRQELSEKYYNNPFRVRHIKDILYRKYPPC